MYGSPLDAVANLFTIVPEWMTDKSRYMLPSNGSGEVTAIPYTVVPPFAGYLADKSFSPCKFDSILYLRIDRRPPRSTMPPTVGNGFVAYK